MEPSSRHIDSAAPGAAAGSPLRFKYFSRLMLAAAMVLPLAGLLPELLRPTADLNDGAFHLGVARETIAVIRDGNSPIDFWMPNWIAGFPLFHYYQCGPYLLLAAFDLLSGGAVPLLVLYRAMTLAALAAFPLANYVAAGWLGLRREVAVWAALLGFMIAGGARYGIELESFTWSGWGLFTQAMALPLLPLALAGGWRATQQGGRTARWAGLLAVTFLAHVLYGYIAALTLLLIPLAAPRLDGARRSAIGIIRLHAQTFALLAFFVLPLMWHAAYHAKSLYDEAAKFDSYGAAEILTWLFSGDLLDHGRLPVMTLLCACGFYLCLREWLINRSWVHGWVVCAFCFWTCLYFGRPTWGALIDLLPMTRGLHLERLSSAVHLFAIWLAAIAAGNATHWCLSRGRTLWVTGATAVALLAAVAVMAGERIEYLQRNAALAAAGQVGFERDRGDFEPVLRFLRAHPGRVYAGRKGNWGDVYKIGDVAVYHLLSAEGIAQIGQAPFSWAWSTDFQVQLDWPEPWAADLYDIRYILSNGHNPGAGWEPALTSGPHHLYRRTVASPFVVVSTPLAIAGDFDDTWYATQIWTKGLWPRRQAHARLIAPGAAAGDLPVLRMLDAFHFTRPDGAVQHLLDPPDLFLGEPSPPATGGLRDVVEKRGEASVSTDLSQAGTVLFKTTYNPGWRAELDGVTITPFQVTPGLLAVDVPAGAHQLRLVYSATWIKTVIALLGLMMAWLLDRRPQPPMVERATT